MDHRQVGSENERRSAQYIKEQFEKIKIGVEIQPFDFESFEYTEVNFWVGNEQFKVEGLGINPYENRKRKYEGTAFLVDFKGSNGSPNQQEIEGKTIITDNWNNHFRLLQYNPGLIIYLDPSVFEKFKSKEKLNYTLTVEGELRKFQSANIIGKIGSDEETKKEILISAHYDTYRKNNPGASDNASGIGVLLELARYFRTIESELDFIVKFVAFGGEEIGIMGSRNYLIRNTHSLRRCELLLNIDDVGGDRSVSVERNGGVSGMPEKKGQSQIPENVLNYAWEGVNSRWRMLADTNLIKIFSASNHPPWLVDVVDKTVEDLGYDIVTTGTQGSDQLAFAHAGIVTSGISIVTQYQHTPQDTPENINKKSLRKAGEIAARVILNALKRFKENRSRTD